MSQQLERKSSNGFDILTQPQILALLSSGFQSNMELLMKPYESLFIDPKTKKFYVEPCLVDQIRRASFNLQKPQLTLDFSADQNAE